MQDYSIERSENGFTVYRQGQAIATFATAQAAIEAARQFRDRPELVRHANVPPAIMAFKARHQAQQQG